MMYQEFQSAFQGRDGPLGDRMGVSKAIGCDVPNFIKDVPNFVNDVPNLVDDVPRVPKCFPR